MLPRSSTGAVGSWRAGEGLGLTVVKDIIVQHSGAVMVTNGEAGGVRVELRLPLEQSGP